ncbi:ABC-2 type transport system ATP-binding protein [Elusimicrobium posterum]|uniref:ABC transporter ATP-binding protein n=1 Tax=Elusimicrobium posterum TaxID=3116653 RepID=UPI003C73D36B
MSIEVKVSNVSKKMGTAQALKNVSTLFEAGRVHGVIGPNGAGKTTLMRLTSGLLTPDSGEITYGLDNQTLKIKQVKNSIAYFPQEPSLYPDLSCMEHMEFFRDLYDITQQEFKQRSEELFNATGMAQFKDRPAGKLSGGMYKKLGLMCVLLNRPKLLLLDEPTIGVDPVSRQQLWDLVYKFAGESMTVIINTSYMDEAQRCAKVHVLENGTLLAQGEPQALSKQFKVTNFADIFLKKNKDSSGSDAPGGSGK